jgi:hypothetical protein
MKESISTAAKFDHKLGANNKIANFLNNLGFSVPPTLVHSK